MMSAQRFLVVLALVVLALPSLAADPVAADRITAIDATRCAALVSSGVLTSRNPVPCERLRSVRFLHHTPEGAEAEGELLVLDVLAARTLALMERLRSRAFPIHAALPMERFGGDDEASMAANNTSGFNARAIAGDARWSMHAYGVAIDLNPVENPYIRFEDGGRAQVLPPQSARYAVNRLETRVGKDPRPGLAESVVLDFARSGYYRWGGDWNDPIDYQHFELGSRRFVEQLVVMTPAQGRAALDAVARDFDYCIGDDAESLGERRRACAAAAVADLEARAH